MGAYLSQPNLEKVSENGENDRIKYGASAMQGWRLAQEDDHNCLSLFAENTELFGVYDGHGGSEVAVYCAKHLPKLIKSSPAFKSGDIEKALEESFMKFDATLKEEKVIQQLKEIAGLNNCSDEEEGEVDNLQEEANLPLGELLTKFGMPSNKNQRSLRKKVNRDDLLSPVVNKKKPVFPLLNDKNSINVTNGGANGGTKATENVETVTESVRNEIKTDVENSETFVENGQKNGQHGNSSRTTSNDVSQSQNDAEQESCKKSETETVCNGEKENNETTQEENHTKKEKSDVRADEEEIEEEEDDEEEEEDYEDEEEDDEEEEFEDDDEDDEEEGLMRPSSGHEEPGSDSGTTACVAVLKGKEVIVANIGDSRCVLSRDGEAVDLSVDHKPEDEEELQRIECAGGKVTQDGRVNGGLNLSRAFGDHCYKTNEELPPEKQMICAFPDLQRATLTEKDEFMVLACDGIWNAMTSQEVIDFVKEKLDEDSNVKLSDICEELFDICLAPDTQGDGTGCDNMTCIIVVFDHDQISPSGKRKAEEADGTTGSPESKRLKL